MCARFSTASYDFRKAAPRFCTPPVDCPQQPGGHPPKSSITLHLVTLRMLSRTAPVPKIGRIRASGAFFKMDSRKSGPPFGLVQTSIKLSLLYTTPGAASTRGRGFGQNPHRYPQNPPGFARLFHSHILLVRRRPERHHIHLAGIPLVPEVREDLEFPKAHRQIEPVRPVIRRIAPHLHRLNL